MSHTCTQFEQLSLCRAAAASPAPPLALWGPGAAGVQQAHAPSLQEMSQQEQQLQQQLLVKQQQERHAATIAAIAAAAASKQQHSMAANGAVAAAAPGELALPRSGGRRRRSGAGPASAGAAGGGRGADALATSSHPWLVEYVLHLLGGDAATKQAPAPVPTTSSSAPSLGGGQGLAGLLLSLWRRVLSAATHVSVAAASLARQLLDGGAHKGLPAAAAAMVGAAAGGQAMGGARTVPARPKVGEPSAQAAAGTRRMCGL